MTKARSPVLAHLIDCAESSQEPVTTVQEIRKSFVVALTAYEAAHTGSCTAVLVG